MIRSLVVILLIFYYYFFFNFYNFLDYLSKSL